MSTIKHRIVTILTVLIATSGVAHADVSVAQVNMVKDANGCLSLYPFSPPPKITLWFGSCVNGYASGHGTLVRIFDGFVFTYIGDLNNGELAGNVHLIASNGDRYDGGFADGKKSGKGVYYWYGGDRYEGTFVDDKYTNGVVYYSDGGRYEGGFVEYKKSGRGVRYYPNGDRYEGDFTDDKATGNGIKYFANGDRYEGDFVDGRLTGKGTLYQFDGKARSGAFVDDVFKESSEKTSSGPASATYITAGSATYYVGDIVFKKGFIGDHDELKILQIDESSRRVYVINIDKKTNEWVYISDVLSNNGRWDENINNAKKVYNAAEDAYKVYQDVNKAYNLFFGTSDKGKK